jgi:hypothetical protein
MLNIFTKKLSGYTQAQVRDLFDHALLVREVWRGNKNSFYPEPIHCGVDSIDYEYVNLPQSVAQQMNNRQCQPDVMRQVGAALARLHVVKQTGSGASLLHADFVPHNLFSDGKNLWIIDAHPPEKLGYRADLLYGNPHRDIVTMVYCIFSNAGLLSVMTRGDYYFVMAREFLIGYAAVTTLPYGFIKPVLKFARDVYVMKTRCGTGRIRAGLHAAGYAVLAMIGLGGR